MLKDVFIKLIFTVKKKRLFFFNELPVPTIHNHVVSPLTSLLCRWLGGRSVSPERSDTGLFLLLQLPLGHNSDGEAGGPETWLQPVWGPQDLGTCQNSVEPSHFFCMCAFAMCNSVPFCACVVAVVVFCCCGVRSDLCFCCCSFHWKENVVNLYCLLGHCYICAIVAQLVLCNHCNKAIDNVTEVSAWDITVCSDDQFTWKPWITVFFPWCWRFILTCIFVQCGLMWGIQDLFH